MKRLVLVGEGHGESQALAILARKALRSNENGNHFFVDDNLLRVGGVHGLVKWKEDSEDFSEWRRRISLASRRTNLGGVVAVFDGDCARFPAGSPVSFCPATAAKKMALAAREVGAGATFSLAVVFACAEYESWLIASCDSMVGKTFPDGRPVLPNGVNFPEGDPEKHGKRWLEKNLPGYRPTRDQGPLTDLLELQLVRARRLRSFTRFENAISQLVNASNSGVFVSTPH